MDRWKDEGLKERWEGGRVIEHLIQNLMKTKGVPIYNYLLLLACAYECIIITRLLVLFCCWCCFVVGVVLLLVLFCCWCCFVVGVVLLLVLFCCWCFVVCVLLFVLFCC